MESNGYALLRNVRLLCPSQKKIENCDILFTQRTRSAKSRVLEVGQGIQVPENCPVKMYAGGSRVYCRAFVDTACYIPNRSGRYGENYASAAQAAQAGGFSSVALMPSAGNPLDTPQAVTKMLQECRNLDVQFLPVAALFTGDRMKPECVNCGEMKKAGAVALAVPEKRYVSPDVMLDAMQKAAEADMTVFCPVSGGHFAQRGAVNDGRIARLLRLPGIPRCAELLSVCQSILLSEESGCRIHIPVISLAESVEYVKRAKEKGVRVTCGTAVQYFSLTEDDLVFRGVNAKLDPPLRTDADRAAIVEGLRDGTIDCIASDHRPCTKEEKGSSIATGAFGAAGLETAFAAGFTFLVLTGKLDLYTLLVKLTVAPASLLGIAGNVTEGAKMDLLMIDEDKEMIYTNNTLRGRAINTPYYGTALRGAVESRFIDGK